MIVESELEGIGQRILDAVSSAGIGAEHLSKKELHHEEYCQEMTRIVFWLAKTDD